MFQCDDGLFNQAYSSSNKAFETLNGKKGVINELKGIEDNYDYKSTVEKIYNDILNVTTDIKDLNAKMEATGKIMKDKDGDTSLEGLGIEGTTFSANVLGQNENTTTESLAEVAEYASENNLEVQLAKIMELYNLELKSLNLSDALLAAFESLLENGNFDALDTLIMIFKFPGGAKAFFEQYDLPESEMKWVDTFLERGELEGIYTMYAVAESAKNALTLEKEIKRLEEERDNPDNRLQVINGIELYLTTEYSNLMATSSDLNPEFKYKTETGEEIVFKSYEEILEYTDDLRSQVNTDKEDIDKKIADLTEDLRKTRQTAIEGNTMLLQIKYCKDAYSKVQNGEVVVDKETEGFFNSIKDFSGKDLSEMNMEEVFTTLNWYMQDNNLDINDINCAELFDKLVETHPDFKGKNDKEIKDLLISGALYITGSVGSGGNNDIYNFLENDYGYMTEEDRKAYSIAIQNGEGKEFLDTLEKTTLRQRQGIESAHARMANLTNYDGDWRTYFETGWNAGVLGLTGAIEDIGDFFTGDLTYSANEYEMQEIALMIQFVEEAGKKPSKEEELFFFENIGSANLSEEALADLDTKSKNGTLTYLDMAIANGSISGESAEICKALQEDGVSETGLSYANDIGGAVGRMLPSIVAGMATGGVLGAPLMALSSAGGTAKQMRRDGYSTVEAYEVGIVNASIEATLETFLGAIPGVSRGTGFLDDALRITALDSKSLKVAKFLAKNFVVAPASEGLQEILEDKTTGLANSIITGDEYVFSDGQELKTFIVSAASSMIINGGTAPITISQTKADGVKALYEMPNIYEYANVETGEIDFKGWANKVLDDLKGNGMVGDVNTNTNTNTNTNPNVNAETKADPLGIPGWKELTDPDQLREIEANEMLAEEAVRRQRKAEKAAADEEIANLEKVKEASKQTTATKVGVEETLDMNVQNERNHIKPSEESKTRARSKEDMIRAEKLAADEELANVQKAKEASRQATEKNTSQGRVELKRVNTENGSSKGGTITAVKVDNKVDNKTETLNDTQTKTKNKTSNKTSQSTETRTRSEVRTETNQDSKIGNVNNNNNGNNNNNNNNNNRGKSFFEENNDNGELPSIKNRAIAQAVRSINEIYGDGIACLEEYVKTGDLDWITTSKGARGLFTRYDVKPEDVSLYLKNLNTNNEINTNTNQNNFQEKDGNSEQAYANDVKKDDSPIEGWQELEVLENENNKASRDANKTPISKKPENSRIGEEIDQDFVNDVVDDGSPIDGFPEVEGIESEDNNTGRDKERIKDSTNRVFENRSAFGLGKNNPSAMATSSNSIYRITGLSQIEDIVNSGYVRPKEGKLKGGHRNEIFWTEGGENLYYYDKRPVLEVKADKLSDGQKGAVSIDDLEAIWIFDEDQNKYVNQLDHFKEQRRLKLNAQNENNSQVKVGDLDQNFENDVVDDGSPIEGWQELDGIESEDNTTGRRVNEEVTPLPNTEEEVEILEDVSPKNPENSRVGENIDQDFENDVEDDGSPIEGWQELDGMENEDNNIGRDVNEEVTPVPDNKKTNSYDELGDPSENAKNAAEVVKEVNRNSQNSQSENMTQTPVETLNEETTSKLTEEELKAITKEERLGYSFLTSLSENFPNFKQDLEPNMVEGLATRFEKMQRIMRDLSYEYEMGGSKYNIEALWDDFFQELYSYNRDIGDIKSLVSYKNGLASDNSTPYDSVLSILAAEIPNYKDLVKGYDINNLAEYYDKMQQKLKLMEDIYLNGQVDRESQTLEDALADYRRLKSHFDEYLYDIKSASSNYDDKAGTNLTSEDMKNIVDQASDKPKFDIDGKNSNSLNETSEDVNSETSRRNIEDTIERASKGPKFDLDGKDNQRNSLNEEILEDVSPKNPENSRVGENIEQDFENDVVDDGSPIEGWQELDGMENEDNNIGRDVNEEVTPVPKAKEKADILEEETLSEVVTPSREEQTEPNILNEEIPKNKNQDKCVQIAKDLGHSAIAEFAHVKDYQNKLQSGEIDYLANMYYERERLANRIERILNGNVIFLPDLVEDLRRYQRLNYEFQDQLKSMSQKEYISAPNSVLENMFENEISGYDGNNRNNLMNNLEYFYQRMQNISEGIDYLINRGNFNERNLQELAYAFADYRKAKNSFNEGFYNLKQMMENNNESNNQTKVNKPDILEDEDTNTSEPKSNEYNKPDILEDDDIEDIIERASKGPQLFDSKGNQENSNSLNEENLQDVSPKNPENSRIGENIDQDFENDVEDDGSPIEGWQELDGMENEDNDIGRGINEEVTPVPDTKEKSDILEDVETPSEKESLSEVVTPSREEQTEPNILNEEIPKNKNQDKCAQIAKYLGHSAIAEFAHVKDYQNKLQSGEIDYLDNMYYERERLANRIEKMLNGKIISLPDLVPELRRYQSLNYEIQEQLKYMGQEKYISKYSSVFENMLESEIPGYNGKNRNNLMDDLEYKYQRMQSISEGIDYLINRGNFNNRSLSELAEAFADYRRTKNSFNEGFYNLKQMMENNNESNNQTKVNKPDILEDENIEDVIDRASKTPKFDLDGKDNQKNSNSLNQSTNPDILED